MSQWWLDLLKAEPHELRGKILELDIEKRNLEQKLFECLEKVKIEGNSPDLYESLESCKKTTGP
jgi:hypothetical protein